MELLLMIVILLVLKLLMELHLDTTLHLLIVLHRVGKARHGSGRALEIKDI
jgi:hypothetical protein